MLENKSIGDYLREYNIQWAMTMPDKCLPEKVCVPIGHTFYRYALNPDCYSVEDFKSYAELNPTRDWGNMLPLAVGLSVIDDDKTAIMNMKLPYLRRFKGVIILTLNPKDGVVKQTGVHKSHYTWWMTMSFDMSNLKMLEL